MGTGRIYKALSGFYYVESSGELKTCKARGKFRKEHITPLVGDNVMFTPEGESGGTIDEILPRKNEFLRPPVANIDCMVIFVSSAVPVTDPFLVDRMIAIAENKNCEPLLCINKTDLEAGDIFSEIYSTTGIKIVRTSAVTGEGVDELSQLIAGKVCAFTGNSGVGKSSILNALEPEFKLAVGEVSEKLGRGRHTTRHIELFGLSCGAVIADTPGFSSFDTERMDLTKTDEVKRAFREFAPFEDECRFMDCAHILEPGCAVLNAVREGKIHPSRHKSYVMLYEQAKQYKEWENK